VGTLLRASCGQLPRFCGKQPPLEPLPHAAAPGHSRKLIAPIPGTLGTGQRLLASVQGVGDAVSSAWLPPFLLRPLPRTVRA